MPEVDWDVLRAAALEAASHSYAPYSGYHVGAAALVDDGRVVSGCNIENASYGIAMCGENSMIAQFVMGGGGRLVAVYTVGNGAAVTPCGRCRQLLWEFGGPDCLVSVDGVPTPLSVLLPAAFPEASNFRPDLHED
jgi:cytidine deaminase